MSEWQETTLGAAFNVNPKREIKRGVVTPFIPMDALPEHARKVARIERREFVGGGAKFRNRDTLLARITPCLENGKTAFVTGLAEDEVAHGSTEYIVISGKDGVSDDLFAYYLARLPGFRSHAIASMEGTSGRQRVPNEAVSRYKLQLPPVEEQRTIAHILGSLDDKIELNRRMNETLEAMARAIFQSWFVDFDPVRAKASGEGTDSICQRLGLSTELLALFPDSFEDSELGEIPTGWALTTLRHMTSKIGSGATPRGGSDVYIGEGTSLIRSQNVYDSNFYWDGLAHITEEAAKQLNGVEVKAGDVLINITGASILRTCVVDPTVLPARVNQHVAIIRAKAGFASRYIHLHLLKASTKAHLMGLNAGASREAITKGHLESLPIITPGEYLLERFGNAVASLYSDVDQLNHQRRTLEGLRDTLLPKLLSREIGVREAEPL